VSRWAAFTLGRVLLDELGRPSEAVDAFPLARSSGGPLAEDALAREVEALSRAGERQSFSVSGSSVVYERIGTDFAGNLLSSFILTVPPDYRSEIVSHEGEEIIYMLAGALTVKVETEEMVLAAGDGFHFRGNRAHSWWNASATPARLLWTGTVALFRRPRAEPRAGQAGPHAVHPSTKPLSLKNNSIKTIKER